MRAVVIQVNEKSLIVPVLGTKCEVPEGENHMDQTQYRCEECGANFNSEVQLERHNRMVHSRYTCVNCSETFSAEAEFEAHNFKMHPELQKLPR